MERTLDHRLESGAYEVLWSGVYALPGSPPTWERSAVAAVLYAGPLAALSHGAAARKYLVSGFERAPVEVTTTRQIRGANFKLHARSPLEPEDVCSRDRIPTTTIERTLLDLCSVVAAERLEAIIDHVCRGHLTTVERIASYLQRDHLPRRRRSVLVRLLDDRGDVEPAASDLETLLARLMRDPSLIEPVRQFEVTHDGRLIARPDFAYPEVKFGIEAHSFDFHHTRAQWERDLERHRELEAIGWYIMYVTWNDCVLRRDQTVARIRRVLEERRRMFGLAPLGR